MVDEPSLFFGREKIEDIDDDDGLEFAYLVLGVSDFKAEIWTLIGGTSAINFNEGRVNAKDVAL